MSKKTSSPEEISKQLASLSPPSPLLRDDEDVVFPLTPPVFSDLSSAPSTLSKDSMANASTSTSKNRLTPLNMSGFSSVSSAPSASASASGRSYLSSPSSYTSNADRDRPLSAIPISPDISFSPLLPSRTPTSSVSSSASSQQKVKKPSVLVPVSSSASSSGSSVKSQPRPLSQPSTIFSLTPTILSSTSSTSSVPSPYVAPIKKKQILLSLVNYLVYQELLFRHLPHPYPVSFLLQPNLFLVLPHHLLEHQ